MVAFALAVWARQPPTAASLGLTGFAAGAAVATKPYAILSLVGDLDPALARLPEPRPPAAAAPGAGDRPAGALWLARHRLVQLVSLRLADQLRLPRNRLLRCSAPLNALGLLFSPGKGLIFYSPLVVLGALGLPRSGARDRR